MRKRLTHVVNDFGLNGISEGIATLIRNGFYAPFDTRIVALRHAHGDMGARFETLPALIVSRICSIPGN